MINVILPVTDNVVEYNNFIKDINNKDVQVFVGVLEKFNGQISSKSKNVQIYYFKNNSNKEEIINSLHSKIIKNGKILVIRRVLEKQEYNSLINSKSDITTLRKTRSRFANFFRTLLDKIVRKVFAFNYFEDISAIAFGESMFDILRSMTNLSYISRIDRFVGVERTEIESKIKSPKKEYKKSKTFLNFSAGALFFASCVAGAVCMCIYLKVSVLLVIGIFAILLFGSVALATSILNLLRTIAVGTLRYGMAEEVFPNATKV